jgi:DNA-binding beta-propeller fold protein YncE
VLPSKSARHPQGSCISWLSCLAVLATLLCLAGCGGSSGGNASSGTAAATTNISGAVDDAFVDNATITAYEVSSAGVKGACVPPPSGSGCATATTSADGSYTLNLGNYSGAVLLQSVGGSYTDTVTGQMVSIPSSLVLSVFLPSVAPGTNTITAQISGMSTMAAQLAMQQMAQGSAAATAASNANTSIQNAFGGLSNLLSTTFIDPTQNGCGTTSANQASFDASLILAGISQLANQYGVTSAALMGALIEDAADGTLDGLLDSATPITVPLATGNGTVSLATIEGSSLALSLEAAIQSFQSSAADVCKATQSSSQAAALPMASPRIVSSMYEYTLNGTVSGLSGSGSLVLQYDVDMGCSQDVIVGSATLQHTIYLSSNGSFTSSIGGSPSSYAPLNYTNCGTNTWILRTISVTGESCSISATTGSFSSNSTGDLNTATPAPIVTCSPLYTVGGTISGLGASGLTLTDNGGDSLTVPATAMSFTFPTSLASGAAYAVSITSQPASENCTLSGNASGTVANADINNIGITCTSTGGGGGAVPGATTVYVIDSTNTLFAFNGQGSVIASAKLPGGSGSVGNLNGGGITADATNVYVTMGAPSTAVAAFNRATLAPVTLANGAFANLSTPRAIVYDPQNAQFYVANGGSTVTVYGATGNYLSSLSQASNAIYGPSGITFDPTDNSIWVANYTGGGSATNPTYGISEFTPSGTLMQNYPTANTNAPTAFAPPSNTGHEMPYAISYCLNTGTTPADALAVGYISDSSNQGQGEAGGYSVAGALAGSGYAGITKLHAVACAPNGNVFVAADNGLLEYSITGSSVGPTAGTFSGLTPPIYGVAVVGGGLNSPEGVLYAAGQLYVANSGTNQVLIYTVQTDPTSGLVTGMSLNGTISSDLDDPVRLAMDAAGHLFVANIANNSVSVYDTSNSNQEIAASGGGPLISGGHLNRPLGVAIDSSGNVYVANNGSNSLSVYNPVTGGSVAAGYTEATYSPVSTDAGGTALAAPGVLFDESIFGSDYLLVGLGPTTGASQILVYSTPFTSASTPVFDLSSANCTSMPTGPTGIAAYVNVSQPTNSYVFMSSYYNAPAGSVVQYSASQILAAQSACPAPTTTGATSVVSRPEGVAVDSAGVNVFVANSGNNTVTVYSVTAGLSAAPVFTLHN